MTVLKKVLLAASALVITSGAAWAGSDNSAITDQQGSSNSLYIDQDVNNAGASRNKVGVNDVYKEYGSGNDIRIVQGGSNNGADGSTTGNSNYIRIDQTNASDGYASTSTTGSNNALLISQSGSSHDARLSVGGNSNYLNVQQGGTNQTASVTINGSGNNTGGSSLFGAAGEFGLARGNLIQTGVDNNVNLVVASGANDNAFSIYQNGTVGGFGNSVNGTITGSAGALAVYQNGAANSATFTQGGYANTMAIKQ